MNTPLRRYARFCCFLIGLFSAAGLHATEWRIAESPKPTTDQGANIEALRSRFVKPPKGSGTTTLWWLNGKLSKEQIGQPQ